MKVLTYAWKDGDFYMQYSPTLNISSHGNTREEAVEMMRISLQSFVTDLRALSLKKAQQVLISMGWNQSKLRNKNFSHVYIDKDGVIQGLSLEGVELEEYPIAV